MLIYNGKMLYSPVAMLFRRSTSQCNMPFSSGLHTGLQLLSDISCVDHHPKATRGYPESLAASDSYSTKALGGNLA